MNIREKASKKENKGRKEELKRAKEGERKQFLSWAQEGR